MASEEREKQTSTHAHKTKSSLFIRVVARERALRELDEDHSNAFSVSDCFAETERTQSRSCVYRVYLEIRDAVIFHEENWPKKS
jgi:hypothetical protein